MKVKVIKEIKGLVPGDILRYNKNNDHYEITKTDYDIGESTSTKIVKFSIGDYLVGEFKDYFVYVDDEDNNVEVKKIYWEDFPISKEQPKEEVNAPVTTLTTTSNVSVDDLIVKINELEKELEEIKSNKVVGYPVYNPFRTMWYF